jgi:hypothetical protein
MVAVSEIRRADIVDVREVVARERNFDQALDPSMSARN